MSAIVGLDAYFQRIGWSGGRDPTLATLAGLIAAHTAHIPFENLDVLLGRTVRLDLESLQERSSVPAVAAIASSTLPCSPPCLKHSVFRSPVMPRGSFCSGHWPTRSATICS